MLRHHLVPTLKHRLFDVRITSDPLKGLWARNLVYCLYLGDQVSELPVLQLVELAGAADLPKGAAHLQRVGPVGSADNTEVALLVPVAEPDADQKLGLPGELRLDAPLEPSEHGGVDLRLQGAGCADGLLYRVGGAVPIAPTGDDPGVPFDEVRT